MRPLEPPDPSWTPPAPVHTGHEVYEIPLPVRPPRPRRRRRSRARLASAALAIISGIWLLTLAASQATSATVVVPFLERTIASLGDTSALLRLYEPQIRNAASQGGGGDRIAVPGFPVPGVTLPRSLAQTGTIEQWHASLLRDSAEAAYERGTAVFAPADKTTSSGTFSTSQWVRIVMGIISVQTHSGATTLSMAFGFLTLALTGVVLIAASGAQRFVGIGLAMVGGAMIAAAAGLVGLLVAFLLNTGTSDSPFIHEVGGLLLAISWTPLYLAACLGVAGIAITLPAAAIAAWFARRYEAPEA